MAAQDPSLIEAMTTSDKTWLAADATAEATLTTEGTDDDTTTDINAAVNSKIGKGGSPHGDVLRVEFSSGFASIAVNDTITVWLGALHNVSDLALLAHTAATTVTSTGKVVQTSVSGQTIFTITQAFIDELVELGTDGFAVRIAEDLGVSGDWRLREVDADLTAGAADVLQAQVWM